MRLKKTLRVLLLYLFLIVPLIATANQTLQILPIGTTQYTRTNGSSGSLSYQFNLANNLSIPLYLSSQAELGALPNLLLDGNQTTCHFGDSVAISPHGSCTLTLTSTVPQLTGDKAQSFFDTLVINDSLGFKTTYNPFGIHVIPASEAGHFVFRNSDGSDITNLDLAPNQAGSLTLHNTGDTTIVSMNLTIPAAISNYFTGNCLSETNLPPGQSCTLNYSIPSSSASTGNYTLSAAGTNTDNSPHYLSVSIATHGHFVFRNSGGIDITNLDLAPNQTGSLSLHNTGGSTITNMSLTIPAAISSYFAGSCLSEASLPSGQSCALTYNIPSSGASTGNYTLTSAGTNADNSPHDLSVSIATHGHFVFRDSGGTDITNFVLAPNQTGSLTLHNTGGSTVTNMSLTIPTAISSYFSGNCLSETILTSGQSCTLNYNIPSNSPSTGSYVLSASGTNADNSPHSLNLVILYPIVTVGSSGTILTSINGINWLTQTSNTSERLWSITFGDNKYVVTGDNGTILTSPDGITWNPQTSGTARDLWNITYANNQFVAVGASGTVLTSPNGIAWTKQTSGVSDSLDGVTYGNGKFVAIGNTGTAISSVDGVTWTEHSTGVSTNLNDIAFGAGEYVAIGHSGTILTSSDALTWTPQASGSTYNLWGISYLTKFIAVAYDTVFLSDDGITWNNKVPGINFYLYGSNELRSNDYIVVGEGGTILTSSNQGNSWTTQTSGTPNDLWSIAVYR